MAKPYLPPCPKKLIFINDLSLTADRLKGQKKDNPGQALTPEGLSLGFSSSRL